MTTPKPDNETRARMLPYSGRYYYYATYYGRILRFDTRTKRYYIVKESKHKPSPHCHNKELYRDFSSGIKSALANKYVHRLVAGVWCECPNMFCLQVDHIDNNKRNCRADNLRWCTDPENKRFAAAIRSGKTIITNLQKVLFYADQSK